MATTTTTNTVAQRKRRRRRRQDKPSIAARLVLDDHVKGDVGILSDDLFADLFPYLIARKYTFNNGRGRRCVGQLLIVLFVVA